MRPEWAPAGPDRLRLLYGHVAVGELTDVFTSDGTWYADFRLTLICPRDATEQRVLEYIAFCSAWVARSYADDRADASEFDQFVDLFSPGSWRTQSPDGVVMEISNSPIFMGDEVSWVYAGSERETRK